MLLRRYEGITKVNIFRIYIKKGISVETDFVWVAV